jgi:hypothetical protein
MSVERKENDKEVEELRGEAEEVESKVSNLPLFYSVVDHIRVRWRII